MSFVGFSAQKKEDRKDSKILIFYTMGQYDAGSDIRNLETPEYKK